MKIICLVLLVSILEVGITTSILIAVSYTHLNNTFYVVSFLRDLMKGDVESCLERTRSFFASIPNDLEMCIRDRFHPHHPHRLSASACSSVFQG